jgi:hypothetical protein
MSEPTMTQEGDRSDTAIPTEREKAEAALHAARVRLNATALDGRADLDVLIEVANEVARSVNSALWHLWRVKDE